MQRKPVNSHFWPIENTRDQTYLPTLSYKKREKNDKTTVFKTLDIRQRRAMIPGTWEVNKVNPVIALAYYLENLPGHSTGWGKLGEAWPTSKVEELELRIQRE